MTQVTWHRRSAAVNMGRLPTFLHSDCPEPAAKQLGVGYAFAGGWRPQRGFDLASDNSLTYPGDPPMLPIAEARLRDETILLYPYSYVAVVQPDRTFEVCRMD